MSALLYKPKSTNESIGYENEIERAKAIETVLLRHQLHGKSKMICYLRRSAAHMETDFTSLKLTPKTLLDGYKELGKTKEEFKDNADFMREEFGKVLRK